MAYSELLNILAIKELIEMYCVSWWGNGL